MRRKRKKRKKKRRKKKRKKNKLGESNKKFVSITYTFDSSSHL